MCCLNCFQNPSSFLYQMSLSCVNHGSLDVPRISFVSVVWCVKVSMDIQLFQCQHALTSFILATFIPTGRGVTRGGQGGHNSPGAESLRGAPKSPNSVTNTLLHLLPKDLGFVHGGARLASCPGRHLTSLRPCPQDLRCV